MSLSRSSKAFLVVLVVLAIVVAAGVWWLLQDTQTTFGDEGEAVTVTIPEGASTAEIAELLADEGVVGSAMAFQVAARFDDRSANLQPGEHELREGMGSREVIAALQREPEPPTQRVTIPEGLTVDQTLERLGDRTDHDAQDFAEALDALEVPDVVPVDDLPEGAQPFEGLLWPDTYEVFDDESPEEILQRLVRTAQSRLDEVEPPEEGPLADLDDYELLIVASLIEREVRLEEERPLVASVIANRLADGMRLKIDATVQYARGEHTERVLFEDLEVDSAWNTYQRDGLPPTPIAGPGNASLRAAADPADTEYRFYVVDDLETGAHAFAETLEEHQRNVAAYRELLEQAGEDTDEARREEEAAEEVPGS